MRDIGRHQPGRARKKKKKTVLQVNADGVFYDDFVAIYEGL